MLFPIFEFGIDVTEGVLIGDSVETGVVGLIVRVGKLLGW